MAVFLHENANQGGATMDKTINIAKQSIRIWPSRKIIEDRDGQAIKSTFFQDHALYHPRLVDWLIDTHTKTDGSEYLFPGACGSKIRDIHNWPLPEARLIQARALELFRRVTGKTSAITDTSWANILTDGDYCFPHSHVRSQASIVYMLDPGVEVPDPVAGRFSIIDPRINLCCQAELGRVTTPFIPDMPPGTMLIFPSEVVHYVSPYLGERPRITLAWNINDYKINEAQPWQKTSK